MDQAITIGMVMWTLLWVVGVFGILFVAVLVLSIITSGWNH